MLLALSLQFSSLKHSLLTFQVYLKSFLQYQNVTPKSMFLVLLLIRSEASLKTSHVNKEKVKHINCHLYNLYNP